MIYTRKGFIDKVCPESTVVASEVEERIGDNCEWFIEIVRPDHRNMWSKNGVKEDDFWEWCSNRLGGYTRCFVVYSDVEWWGFTHKKDITLFLLKWG